MSRYTVGKLSSDEVLKMVEHLSNRVDGIGTVAKRVLVELKKAKVYSILRIKEVASYLSNSHRKQYLFIKLKNSRENEVYKTYKLNPDNPDFKKEYAMQLIDGQRARYTQLMIMGYTEGEIIRLIKENLEGDL